MIRLSVSFLLSILYVSSHGQIHTATGEAKGTIKI